MNTLLATALLTAILLVLVDDSSANLCSRHDFITKTDETFDCPRLFESRKKKHCCGMGTRQGYCCEWSKKSKELADFTIGRNLFDSFISVVVAFLLVVGGIIAACCFCVCCLMSKRRQFRGQVLGGPTTLGDTSVQHVNGSGYPNYPAQQQAGYQMMAPPLPTEQPPPYNPNYPPYPVDTSHVQPPYNPMYPMK